MTVCTIEALYLPVVFILFLSDPADEMAVRQRIFNSTSPFSGSPQAELKGSYPSCSAVEQEAEEEDKEGKDSKTGYTACMNPLIKKLLTHGTAEQVGEKPLKTSTFIAQAECNYVFLIYLIINIIPVDLELTLCSPQVKPRIPKSLVHPALNAPMSPPRTASPAGMTLLLHIASALDILCLFTQVILNDLTPCLVLTSLPSLCFKCYLRAQQCGEHGLFHPGAEQLVRSARPRKEGEEETEAKGEEETGEEEREAETQTSNALWSP